MQHNINHSETFVGATNLPRTRDRSSVVTQSPHCQSPVDGSATSGLFPLMLEIGWSDRWHSQAASRRGLRCTPNGNKSSITMFCLCFNADQQRNFHSCYLRRQAALHETFLQSSNSHRTFGTFSPSDYSYHNSIHVTHPQIGFREQVMISFLQGRI